MSVRLEEFPRKIPPALEQLTKRYAHRHNVCLCFIRLLRTATDRSVQLRNTQRRGSDILLSLTCAGRTRRVSKMSLQQQQHKGVARAEVSCESVGSFHCKIPGQVFHAINFFLLPHWRVETHAVRALSVVSRHRSK